jgi:hypothetical protein
VPRIYSARDKFFLKLKVNRQIFSVNCRSARTIGTIGSTGIRSGLRVDVSELGNLTRTGAEQLRRAGMNVDLQEIDFGSVARRRGN